MTNINKSVVVTFLQNHYYARKIHHPPASSSWGGKRAMKMETWHPWRIGSSHSPCCFLHAHMLLRAGVIDDLHQWGQTREAKYRSSSFPFNAIHFMQGPTTCAWNQNKAGSSTDVKSTQISDCCTRDDTAEEQFYLSALIEPFSRH